MQRGKILSFAKVTMLPETAITVGGMVVVAVVIVGVVVVVRVVVVDTRGVHTNMTICTVGQKNCTILFLQ